MSLRTPPNIFYICQRAKIAESVKRLVREAGMETFGTIVHPEEIPQWFTDAQEHEGPLHIREEGRLVATVDMICDASPTIELMGITNVLVSGFIPQDEYLVKKIQKGLIESPLIWVGKTWNAEHTILERQETEDPLILKHTAAYGYLPYRIQKRRSRYEHLFDTEKLEAIKNNSPNYEETVDIYDHTNRNLYARIRILHHKEKKDRSHLLVVQRFSDCPQEFITTLAQKILSQGNEPPETIPHFERVDEVSLSDITHRLVLQL